MTKVTQKKQHRFYFQNISSCFHKFVDHINVLWSYFWHILEGNEYTNICLLPLHIESEALGPCSYHPSGDATHKEETSFFSSDTSQTESAWGSISNCHSCAAYHGVTWEVAIIYCFSDTKVRKESSTKQVNGAKHHPAHYINFQKTITKWGDVG